MTSTGGDLADFIGSLTLAGGDHDGEPFTVLGWERRFVSGAFRVPGDSALSVGARKWKKSALCAGIAAAVVDPSGPLHGRRREAVVSAASFDQGRVIFEDVLTFLGARYDIYDRSEWRKQDSANRAHIEHRASAVRGCGASGRIRRMLTGCGRRWCCATNRLSGSRRLVIGCCRRCGPDSGRFRDLG